MLKQSPRNRRVGSWHGMRSSGWSRKGGESGDWVGGSVSILGLGIEMDRLGFYIQWDWHFIIFRSCWEDSQSHARACIGFGGLGESLRKSREQGRHSLSNKFACHFGTSFVPGYDPARCEAMRHFVFVDSWRGGRGRTTDIVSPRTQE